MLSSAFSSELIILLHHDLHPIQPFISPVAEVLSAKRWNQPRLSQSLRIRLAHLALDGGRQQWEWFLRLQNMFSAVIFGREKDPCILSSNYIQCSHCRYPQLWYWMRSHLFIYISHLYLQMIQLWEHLLCLRSTRFCRRPSCNGWWQNYFLNDGARKHLSRSASPTGCCLWRRLLEFVFPGEMSFNF